MLAVRRVSVGWDILWAMDESVSEHDVTAYASLSRTTIGNMTLEPAVMTASGAVDPVTTDSRRRAPLATIERFGAWVTKTMTRHSRVDRERPVVANFGAGSLVNAVGLANAGCERVITGLDELLCSSTCRVANSIVSVAGTEAELVDMVQLLEERSWVAGYELNLSCPNVGSLVMTGADERAASRHVAAVRAATARPLLVKMTPACSDPAGIGRAIEDAGGDAIVAGNTMPVVALDDAVKPMLSARDAGMSGRALHAINLRLVSLVSRAVTIPVIGCGGVADRASAARMVACGAQAVQIGTALHLEPANVASLLDAVGAHTTDSCK